MVGPSSSRSGSTTWCWARPSLGRRRCGTAATSATSPAGRSTTPTGRRSSGCCATSGSRRLERMPYFTGTAELNAMVARVAPDVLALLADGVPRPKAAIVAALADRHAADDVRLTLVRLAVTGRVVETGGGYR